ncbi:hypothetical protein [Streptomyces sp. NPDC005374]|uniref:hypothetical protein n=1 Tax=Streptomyces sp. NPDC005374 TaxID=3364713 RepID=UPI00369155AA
MESARTRRHPGVQDAVEVTVEDPGEEDTVIMAAVTRAARRDDLVCALCAELPPCAI